MEQQKLREQEEAEARQREDKAGRLAEQQQVRADLKECESRINAGKNSSTSKTEGQGSGGDTPKRKRSCSTSRP